MQWTEPCCQGCNTFHLKLISIHILFSSNHPATALGFAGGRRAELSSRHCNRTREILLLPPTIPEFARQGSFFIKQVLYESTLHRKRGCALCILRTILWLYDHAPVSQFLSAVEPGKAKTWLKP